MVEEIRSRTIEKFGAQEWEKAVLTHQVHGHLGIYSLLGVKMGCLAVELLGADASHPSISVLSFAGNVPPLSCMNDGLQVSTGSTLGRGLITVSPEAPSRSAAQFSCGGKTIRLSLKAACEQRIQDDIRKAKEQFATTPAYWEAVRKAAIGYWSTWDRHEIFDIEQL